jgi:hypothetical protein
LHVIVIISKFFASTILLEGAKNFFFVMRSTILSRCMRARSHCNHAIELESGHNSIIVDSTTPCNASQSRRIGRCCSFDQPIIGHVVARSPTRTLRRGDCASRELDIRLHDDRKYTVIQVISCRPSDAVMHRTITSQPIVTKKVTTIDRGSSMQRDLRRRERISRRGTSGRRAVQSLLHHDDIDRQPSVRATPAGERFSIPSRSIPLPRNRRSIVARCTHMTSPPGDPTKRSTTMECIESRRESNKKYDRNNTTKKNFAEEDFFAKLRPRSGVMMLAGPHKDAHAEIIVKRKRPFPCLASFPRFSLVAVW